MPLVNEWIRKIKDDISIKPFSDMRIAPVLLGGTIKVLENIGKSRLTGIFQYSGSVDVSYAQIAYHICGKIGGNIELVQPVPAATAGIPESEIFSYTSLDCSRLTETTGIEPEDTWEVIDCTFLGSVQQDSIMVKS